jgi:hypothetical protein
MPDQLQLRGGTTAQHASFTGASKEITVDTTKKTVVVHDGSTVGGVPVMREDAANAAIGQGSAATPSIKFAGDANTGIYSPGADQLAISTGGTGRLFVDASGRLGLGTSSPQQLLHVHNSSAADARIKISNGTTGPGQYDGFELNCGSTGLAGIIQWEQQPIYFYTNNGSAVDPRLVITAAGNVGVGTTSPSTYNANLAIYSAGGAFVGALHANASGTFPKASAISLGSDAVSYTYTTGGTTVALSGSAHIAALQSASSGANTDIAFINTSGGSVSEKARIDSSGRLLVGTSTALTGSSSQYSKLAVQGNSANAFGGYFSIGYGGAATGLSAGSDIGIINFTDTGAGQFAQIRCDTDATTSAGDFPGRLVFSTTADGASSPTERMRITSGGSVQCASATGSTPVLSVDNSSNVSGSQVLYLANRANANDTSSYYIIAQEPGVANRFFVYGNGNVANTNNSYGAISDVKLKENIIDASSQWNDLKALRVRNYNFKPETGQQTHTQIGLVAQEVEVVSPGLIYESPDLDAEGNDLGTVTKSVNYSVLYMKAVKALQEAMQRIETLEAKVAALEAA